ncbi:hypothetical protein QJS10_CPA10g01191 [Acorus calamus]|uniref:Uncharacterized protein n=1 Tax=Acorus calamus TaxID=4465 RepID=A0AAV9E2Y7_ACOCL|nr:hypothetical protein QJS10_CPA10g01191 [Acorus calamus]
MGMNKRHSDEASDIYMCCMGNMESDVEAVIQAISNGQVGPMQLHQCITRIQKNIYVDDPIHFCKVSRQVVKAPEHLARMAAHKQLQKFTIGLQDEEVHACIRSRIGTLTQCIREVQGAQTTSH